MAGLGFKDFAVGEVLTAADVDGYLMQQTVMRFADSGARGSALGTATGTAVPLAEGMVAYLDDTNKVEVYNGSTWLNVVPGVGPNVVQTIKTDTFTTTSGTFGDITGLTATITPTSATSKILIIANVTYSTSTADTNGGHLRLAGGNAGTYVGAADGSKVQATTMLLSAIATGSSIYGQQGWTSYSTTMVYLDSPATTSATTYSVQARIGGAGTFYVNRAGDELQDSARYARTPSGLVVIEVAA